MERTLGWDSGVKETFRRSEALLEALHGQGLYQLRDASSLANSNAWSQGWATADHLNLGGDMAEEWRKYVLSLSNSAIRLTDEEDHLCWSKNPAADMYTFKLGYAAKFRIERACRDSLVLGTSMEVTLPTQIKNSIMVGSIQQTVDLGQWAEEVRIGWAREGAF